MLTIKYQPKTTNELLINKNIIDIANGEKLDDNIINYKNVENRKTNKYAWVCYYLLENSLNNF